MSLCTLGFYEIYWNYRNWSYIRRRDESSISPVWRSIFYPLWFYSLLTDISEHTSEGALSGKLNRILLAISLLTLSALYRLPDPYWLLSFLTFVPALPAIRAISAVNSSSPSPIKFPSRSYTPANFAAFVLGGPIVIFSMLSALGAIPGTSVVDGSALAADEIEYLQTNDILGPEEEITYFYSAGIFSIKSDGQFISNDYVTSYWIDASDGELYVAYAAYDEISDIDVEWAESFLDETTITVTLYKGDSFILWVSAEAGGDKRFVSEMKRLWRASRSPI